MDDAMYERRRDEEQSIDRCRRCGEVEPGECYAVTEASACHFDVSVEGILCGRCFRNAEAGERIVRAAKAHGASAGDVRDASRTIALALVCGIKDDWREASAEAALGRLGPDDRAVQEIMGRAVEAILCERFGAPHNAYAFAMDMPGVTPLTVRFEAAIRLAMTQSPVVALADAIVAFSGAERFGGAS